MSKNIIECNKKVKKQNLMDFLINNISRVNRIKAESIVDFIIDNSLKAIDDHKWLLDIKGIAEKSALNIKESLNIYFELKEILSNIKNLENVEELISIIYKKLGKSANHKIRENPYCICLDCNIDFSIADKIALNNGCNFDDINRIKQGIMCFINNEIEKKGDVFTYKNTIVNEVGAFLNDRGVFVNDITYTNKTIDVGLKSLLEEEKLVEEVNDKGSLCIYRADYNLMEEEIVRRINECLAGKGFFENNNKLLPDENTRNYNLNYEQSEAIAEALTNKLTVITGGPGTGKTQIINVLNAYIHAIKPNAVVEISTPTGKAANRISSGTRLEAKTIHRLLNLSIADDDKKQKNKIDADFVIVDEASMIDQYLFYQILINIGHNTNVVIIGDVEQLQSIGPGSILKDLINSRKVPVVRLKEIYRQGAESLIVKNSYGLIDKDKKQKDLEYDEEEFIFIEADETIIMDKFISVIEGLMVETDYNFDDIMILSPLKDGALGVNAINNNFQNWCQEGFCNELERINQEDRVMQVVNNFNLGVMNGDVGMVQNIKLVDDDEVYVVKFSNKEVEYNSENIKQLELAYAITIHKSQGSEYPVVIIPICESNMYSTNLNALYTGITRAKNKIIFIGNKDVLNKVVNKKEQKIRNSRICEKLSHT